MLKIAVDYYRKLFGEEEKMDVSLMDSFWEPEDMVTEEENIILDEPFTEEEIKEVVFGSYVEGALGPNGFTFLFYHKFWEAIKRDLINLFRDFDNILFLKRHMQKL
jgi:hypothetical protein